MAQSGTRLVKDDISALIKTQEDLRLLIDNFSFTLGFSGSYFKNGDQLEIEGDEQLIGKKIYLIICKNFGFQLMLQIFCGFLTLGDTIMFTNTLLVI